MVYAIYVIQLRHQPWESGEPGDDVTVDDVTYKKHKGNCIDIQWNVFYCEMSAQFVWAFQILLQVLFIVFLSEELQNWS